MKKLVLKSGLTPNGFPIEIYTEIDSDDERYIDDIKRTVVAFKERGYEIDILTAYNAYCARNEDYCASWLTFPPVDSIVDYLLPYCTVVE